MITEVVMVRNLFGMNISQKSKSEYFSLTDLVKAGNKWRSINELPLFDINGYMKQKSTIEFMKELNEKFGQSKISARGRGEHTWIHPFLFVDVALAISPKLKIETYTWLFDTLLKDRNCSGDSYKKMAGAVYLIENRKCDYTKTIAKVAKEIQFACGVVDWQRASTDQLRLRDRIHENICIISDFVKNVDECVRLSIHKAKFV